MVGRKRSEIWNYFISVSDEKAICNECQDSVAQGGDKNNHSTPQTYESHHPDNLRKVKRKPARRKQLPKNKQVLHKQHLMSV